MGFIMQGQTSKTILRNQLQRKLRSKMTEAEKKLWHFLRARQLAGMKFRRQHPFENYVLDFVCLENKLVIEIDGGQHQEQTAADDQRSKILESAGFRVLRFWNHEVLQHPQAVTGKIWQEVADKTAHPHPGPLLEGEGVRSDTL
jgi:very-short-patch-repair endonuclease